MKKIILITTLLLAITISYGQVIQTEIREPNEVEVVFPEQTKLEMYLISGMIIGTFSLVQYLGTDIPIHKRNVIAVTCIGSTWGAYLAINWNDIFKKNKHESRKINR